MSCTKYRDLGMRIGCTWGLIDGEEMPGYAEEKPPPPLPLYPRCRVIREHSEAWSSSRNILDESAKNKKINTHQPETRINCLYYSLSAVVVVLVVCVCAVFLWPLPSTVSNYYYYYYYCDEGVFPPSSGG